MKNCESAQKELAHNEALQVLDLALCAAVAEPPRGSPPSSPAIGDCYLVAVGATGEWAGREHSIAGHTSGGWRFIAPVEGLTALVRSTGTWAVYRNGGWELGALRGSAVIIGSEQVVGARRPAIGAPTGGSVVDTEGRAVIAEILDAMRQHGLVES